MSQEAKPAEPAVRLRRIRVKRVGSTIFIPLPRELWVSCDGCCCIYCSPARRQSNPEAYWDTLAVSTDPKANGDHTWTVHAPELHGARKKREG